MSGVETGEYESSEGVRDMVLMSIPHGVFIFIYFVFLFFFKFFIERD